MKKLYFKYYFKEIVYKGSYTLQKKNQNCFKMFEIIFKYLQLY